VDQNDRFEQRSVVGRLTQENFRLKVLNDFAVKLIGLSTEQELAGYAAREVVGKLGFVDCVIYFLDREKGVLFQAAAIGNKNPHGDEIMNPLEIPVGEGITGTVAQSRKPLLVNDLGLDERYIFDIEKAGSEICAPIMFGGTVQGVIDSEHPNPGHFGDTDLAVLEAVSALMGARLQSISKARDLEESEQRFRNFFKLPLIGAAIYRVDDKSWISANTAFCQMMGYSREELSPLTWVDLTHPDDVDENLQLFQRAVSGDGDGAYSMKKRFIRKDGEVILTEIHAQCIRDQHDRPDYNVLSVRKFDEHKTVGEDFRESKRRVRAD